MTIDLICSQCQKTLRVPDSAAGKRAKCPACNHVMEVPASAPDTNNPFVIPSGSTNPFSAANPSTPATSTPASAPGMLPPLEPLKLGPNPLSMGPSISGMGGGSIPPAGSGQANPFADAQPSLNPYASTTPPSAFHPGGYQSYQVMTRENALQEVATAAILQIVSGFLLLTVQLGYVGLGIFMIMVGGPNDGDAVPAGIFYMVMGGVFGMLAGLIIYGAFAMKNLTSYSMALTSLICSIVLSLMCGCPCFGMTIVISMPISIFGLIKVNDSRVRPFFLS